MLVLAEALAYFNDDDDEEVIRLFEQSKAMFALLHGSSSSNVAASEGKLGVVYQNRAARAHDANDLDHELTNLELALSRYRETARIFRAINHIESADQASRIADEVEEELRQVAIVRSEAVIRG